MTVLKQFLLSTLTSTYLQIKKLPHLLLCRVHKKNQTKYSESKGRSGKKNSHRSLLHQHFSKMAKRQKEVGQVSWATILIEAKKVKFIYSTCLTILIKCFLSSRLPPSFLLGIFCFDIPCTSSKLASPQCPYRSPCHSHSPPVIQAKWVI